IIIIVVLLALVVAAGYLVWQSVINGPLEPTILLDEKQRAVKESFESFLVVSMNEVLDEFYSTGGVSSEKINSEINKNYAIDYSTDEKVMYWQTCNDLAFSTPIEIIEQDMSTTLKNYIKNPANIDKVKDNFNNVEFMGSPEVIVRILDNKIEASVVWETVVEGKSFSQYKASVDSKFKELYNFASAFAVENKNERHFEQYVAYSMMLTTPDDSFIDIDTDKFVPVNIAQLPVPFSKVIVIPPFMLMDRVEYVIHDTLSDVRLWAKPPNPGTTNPDYSILSLNGLTYPQFQTYKTNQDNPTVSFSLGKEGDTFALNTLTPSNFKSNPSTIIIKPKIIVLIGTSIPDPAVWSSTDYDFTFPVIVSLDDSLRNKKFKFATLNRLSYDGGNNAISKDECGSTSSVSTYCSQGTERAKIKVVDEAGEGVIGAYVSFGGCLIYDANQYVTDADGYVEGYMPEGVLTGDLNVFKQDYIEYSEPTSNTCISIDRKTDDSNGLCTSPDISGDYAIVELKQNPIVTFHFYEVPIYKKIVSNSDLGSKYDYIFYGETNDNVISLGRGYPSEITSADAVVSMTLTAAGHDDILITNAGEGGSPTTFKTTRDIPKGVNYDVELFSFSTTPGISLSEGKITSVPASNVVYVDAIQTQGTWSIDPTLFNQVSTLVFSSGDFSSLVTGIDSAAKKIELKDVIPDEIASKIGLEEQYYKIVNSDFKDFMHLSSVGAASGIEITGDDEYYIYVPKLEADNPAQGRLFNMFNYARQQYIIEQVFSANNCGSFNVINYLPIGFDNDLECTYSAVSESCWVTPYLLRGVYVNGVYLGGFRECGSATYCPPGMGIIGGGCWVSKVPASGAYYSCMVGDEYATAPSCFPNKCPGTWLC
ncbi:MAG: hypothetical protein ABIF08_04760, partial [Nanoarchaeota archaeon]